MADYSNSCIYIITTKDEDGNEFEYVGSTKDFHDREHKHKHRIKKECCFKLYKKINENNGDWKMKELHKFPCENELQLVIEEQRVMDERKPTLNDKRAFVTEEVFKEKKRISDKKYNEKYKERINEQHKKYYQANKKYFYEYKKKRRADYPDIRKKADKIWRDKNKEKLSQKITCECGCVISKAKISRHKKTDKHKNLMNNK